MNTTAIIPEFIKLGLMQSVTNCFGTARKYAPTSEQTCNHHIDIKSVLSRIITYVTRCVSHKLDYCYTHLIGRSCTDREKT